MATPKKGQGIAFKIPEHTDQDSTSSDAKVEAKPTQPRTGVGMLSRLITGAHADGEAVAKLSKEVEDLKQRVGEQLIDPKTIALTRWADRHPDSFTSQAFADLKQEIASAGGNVQPVKVRPIRRSAADPADGARFELVYGSRRTRACLELGLPVRAVIEENIDDQSLYIQMQRENRGRSNLSAWEQGVSYHKALREGLFPSARRLAEQIGLDHSNVAKALRVAELPPEVVGAFRSPVDIQFRWAVGLDKAFQQSPEAVLATARALAGRIPRPAAAEVYRSLVEATAHKATTRRKSAVQTFSLGDGKKGVIRSARGGAISIELPRGVLIQAQLDAFEAGLQKLLTELQTLR